MLLEDFIIVVYIWVDDQLKAWLGPRCLRQYGCGIGDEQRGRDLEHWDCDGPRIPAILTDARTWTYADLDEASDGIAAALADRGIVPGDRGTLLSEWGGLRGLLSLDPQGLRRANQSAAAAKITILPRGQFILRERVEEGIAQACVQTSGLAACLARGERHEPGVWLAGLGEDDLLSGMGLFQQAGKMGLGFMDVDGQGHSERSRVGWVNGLSPVRSTPQCVSLCSLACHTRTITT